MVSSDSSDGDNRICHSSEVIVVAHYIEVMLIVQISSNSRLMRFSRVTVTNMSLLLWCRIWSHC